MGFLEQLKALFSREATDAKEWLDDSVRDADAALDRAERRQAADPDERLAMTLDDIKTGDDAFEAIRAKADALDEESDQG
ncbi:MAG: hypothetical protein ACR2HR_06715 [Euzebya sp.]